MAIAIEIAHCQGLWLDARRPGLRWRKCAVAEVEQHAHRVVSAVRHREVGVTVAIEISYSSGIGSVTRRVHHLRHERAVASIETLPAILLHPPSANERTSKGDRPHDARRKAIVKAMQVRMTDVSMDSRRMSAADHRQPSGCSRVSFPLGDGASSRVKSTCFDAMPKGIVRRAPNQCRRLSQRFSRRFGHGPDILVLATARVEQGKSAG